MSMHLFPLTEIFRLDGQTLTWPCQPFRAL